MVRAQLAVVFTSIAMGFGGLAHSPHQDPIVGAPPERTAMPAVIEWRYADGSRLTYTGRDAVMVDSYISGAEAMLENHGGDVRSSLAGVRWTHRAADGRMTHGVWPGELDGQRAVPFGPESKQLSSTLLTRLLPKFRFSTFELPAAGEPPVELVHVVVAFEPGAIDAEHPRPNPLLDDDASVIRFLATRLPKLEDETAIRAAATAFGQLRGLIPTDSEPTLPVSRDAEGWRVSLGTQRDAKQLLVRDGRLQLASGSGSGSKR